MSHPLKGKYCVALGVNYIYCGTLEDVTPDRIVMADPSIVYETGNWSDAQWKDAQRLPTNRVHIERSGVESMFEVIRETGKKNR